MKTEFTGVWISPEVWSIPNQSVSARVLLGWLLFLCKKRRQRHCTPTNAELSTAMHASESQVRQMLYDLKKGGHLKTEGEGKNRQILPSTCWFSGTLNGAEPAGFPAPDGIPTPDGKPAGTPDGKPTGSVGEPAGKPAPNLPENQQVYCYMVKLVKKKIKKVRRRRLRLRTRKRLKFFPKKNMPTTNRNG